MKTTRIQFNSKDFKVTRDVLNAYFGAKFDLAIELDKTKKATSDLAKVIAHDEDELIKVALGGDNAKGILRTREQIEKALATNRTTYNTLVKPYNKLVDVCAKAIADGIALFNNKDSALYKAYVDYVTEPTDDKYNVYAKAMADRFVELGLKDATVDNVAHYMPNSDRALRGKTAVKNGDIRGALNPTPFADAVLGKLYTNNKSAFHSDKFAKYVEKCKADAKTK